MNSVIDYWTLRMVFLNLHLKIYVAHSLSLIISSVGGSSSVFWETGLRSRGISVEVTVRARA